MGTASTDAARLIENNTDETLQSILLDYLKEVLVIIDKRKIEKLTDMTPVLDQLDKRWREFAEEVGSSFVNPDAFQEVIRHEFELFWHAWKGGAIE